ncbi:hypothetical protein HYPSUDRAFT_43681 [Hypholoma sublateritium FD-334 SS-4]|uniref:Uncharacterized protein n=1 Tax=Hypholoma sublateritium (strain FD-334 SS-4) TaxID=945553 RepID=A0A0D2PJ87_HYPSF|nr:hypothetical protein HYPSUDRAFT_43681 [Hypholoma sublateritium FD-334 SS-4]
MTSRGLPSRAKLQLFFIQATYDWTQLTYSSAWWLISSLRPLRSHYASSDGTQNQLSTLCIYHWGLRQAHRRNWSHDYLRPTFSAWHSLCTCLR